MSAQHLVRLRSAAAREASSRQRPGALPSTAAVMLDLLACLKGGSIDVMLPDGSSRSLGHGERRAEMVVTSWQMFERTLASGDIGFAESYVDGQWDSPQLTGLLTLLAGNRDTLARAVHGRWTSVLWHRLRHLARSNTRRGSRRNILAHYDLGNEFYAAWLDPSMTYSAALFDQHANDLQAAQQAKYARVLDRLGATHTDLVLEIGCGWGGFAEAAIARGVGALHGITLSPSQLAYCRQRALDRGFAGQARFALTDYRDLAGQFDHVVSIEMFEAVGERYWPRFFDTIKQVLAPGGRAIIQSIVIRDDLFAGYRKGTDFIQRHIFPGGMLPSAEAFRRQAGRAGMRVSDEFHFGEGYAQTLAQWHARFDAAWPAIESMGFDERFRRLWKFYLAYCEGGFRAGTIDVVQFELGHE